MSDVTNLLNAAAQGDLKAADQVLPLVYEELRKLARRRLARERPGQTLDATALVHDAYLRPCRGWTCNPAKNLEAENKVAHEIESDIQLAQYLVSGSKQFFQGKPMSVPT
jgi:hypothetical protein